VVVVPVLSVVLDRDSVSSVASWSDGSGSPVEDEPLSQVSWRVVLDSESVLVVTNMLMPEEGLSTSHSRSDLEELSGLQWISWEVGSLSVEIPSLVETIVASVEDKMSVVMVLSVMDIKAVTTTVSEVSSSSWEVGESLSGIVWNVLSNNSSLKESHELTSLVGDGVVSSRPGSDGSGSVIESEPLFVVSLKNVLDSESVLVSTDMLSPCDSSSTRHS